MKCLSSITRATLLVGTAGCLALTLFAGVAWAQTPQRPAQPAQPAPMNMAMDHRGAIQGRVQAAAGVATTGMTVTAVNAENGAKFVATPDAQGGYQFAALPVGRYTVTVTAAGLTAFRRANVEVADGQTARLDITLDAASAAQAADAERQQMLEEMAALRQRVADLESSTVLSDPETRVRRVEVFVDPDGNEHDEPVPGAKPQVTYRRERVYRRQTINEKIEEALADAEAHSVMIGVDAAITAQFAKRTKGDEGVDNTAYALASADLFFTAEIAQNTLFFADVVGLSGPAPNGEIPALTLLNGYEARLNRQNELNLREAWLRTELFGNRLALTAGRLDLTNYFDANAFSNDESTQFLSDALVNNQMLGLGSNGTGFAAEFDVKNGLRLKFGLQQSDDEARNLSDALFTLSEVGYTLTPFGLPEGTYRVWFRTNNTDPEVIEGEPEVEGDISTGWGISLDQKLTAAVGVFGRYGTTEQLDFEPSRSHYFSFGLSFQNGFIFNPQDTWGAGFSQMELPFSVREKLLEVYYNFHLTERLRLSFHGTGVLESPGGGAPQFGYFLPGVRLQAAF